MPRLIQVKRSVRCGFQGTLGAAVFVSLALAAEEGCLDCHAESAQGHIEAHRFPEAACTTCHAGDPSAGSAEAGHNGLIAFPGNLDNAARTCGACHAEQLTGVLEGTMHRGEGMVRTTRQVLGGDTSTDRPHNLQSLGHGPADSLLRKLCASCHLGQPKRRHALDATRDRGGGCLACHVNAYPEGAHPRIDARVEDGRCFGCHSRSGRISLSYPGLGETDAMAETDGVRYARLADGRLVRHLASDVHHLAGMACIDCHTGRGLMGQLGDTSNGIDIACSDCHANTNPRTSLSDRGDAPSSGQDRIPFPATPDQPFLTTRHGTALWHIEIGAEELRLHLRHQDRSRVIPQISADHVPLAGAHERLSCDACHAQWAPQCHGCHMSYEPSEWQWDHVERAFTPGTWHEQRWGVRNAAPPLGLDGEDRIVPVVPGMILTAEHPDWGQVLFVRRFAPIAPHTSGPARSCESCHRSSTAVGLGAGRLRTEGGGLRFEGATPPGPDGLPLDAWTTLDASPAAERQDDSPRAFSPGEIRRILRAPLEQRD
jgi:hypothetical protein